MSWASGDCAAFSDKQMERDQFPWGCFMNEKVAEPHRLLKDEDGYIFSRRVFGGLEEPSESGLLSVVAEVWTRKCGV